MTADPWADSPPPGDPDDANVADEPECRRHVQLVAASTIEPRRTFWLWDQRLALGTLALLAGPEGLGKSTLAYWLAAEVTRGRLPGEHLGDCRPVLVCAAEDSWAQTIVPRLIASGADLDLVFRVDVWTAGGLVSTLDLPRDLVALEHSATSVRAALLLLDPLMSRLSDGLDTHRDGDVRRALEPLVAVAERSGMAVLGLIHHNKSGSADPLQNVMASKAFTAVARSVHTVIKDPDDDTETRRLFGTPKNNLASSDLPTLGFTIMGAEVETVDGPTQVGRLEWGRDGEGSIGDAMRRTADVGSDRTAVAEAAEWLCDYLTDRGGEASSADVRKAGQAAAHSLDSLKRARKRAGVESVSAGFPRTTVWRFAGPAQSEQQSEHKSAQPVWGESPTALTAPTGPAGAQSVQWEQLAASEADSAPTGARL